MKESVNMIKYKRTAASNFAMCAHMIEKLKTVQSNGTMETQ
jgi:hypothetical protein